MWRLDTDLEMSSKASVINSSFYSLFSFFESHRKAMLLNIITLNIWNDFHNNQN